MSEITSPFGLMAEFATAEALVRAARRARAAGYRRMDGFSPFPVEGLTDALGLRHTRVPLIVLIGGIVGAVGGFFMMWYSAVIDYPLNVGGRPLNSWPAFIPITFELTVLIAGLSAVIGMLVLNHLPQPYHPVFNVEAFREHASRDGFFLVIESEDERYRIDETYRFLMDLNPVEVHRVDP